MSLSRAIASEGLVSVAGVVATLLLVNSLGFEARGVLFELQNFAGLFAAIAFLGLNVSLPKTPELATVSLFLCVNLFCLLASSIVFFWGKFPSDEADLFLSYCLCNAAIMLCSIVLLSRMDLFRYAILNSTFNVAIVIYCVLVNFYFLPAEISTLKKLLIFLSGLAGVMASIYYFKYVVDFRLDLISALDTLFVSARFAPYTLFSGAPLYYIAVFSSLSEYFLGVIAVLLSFSNLVLKFCRHVLISRLSNFYDKISVSLGLDVIIFISVVSGTYISLMIFFPLSPNDYVLEIFLIGVAAALLPRISEVEGDALLADRLVRTTTIRFASLLVFIALFELSMSKAGFSPVTCFALSLLGCRFLIYVLSKSPDQAREIP